MWENEFTQRQMEELKWSLSNSLPSNLICSQDAMPPHPLFSLPSEELEAMVTWVSHWAVVAAVIRSGKRFNKQGIKDLDVHWSFRDMNLWVFITCAFVTAWIWNLSNACLAFATALFPELSKNSTYVCTLTYFDLLCETQVSSNFQQNVSYVAK